MSYEFLGGGLDGIAGPNALPTRAGWEREFPEGTFRPPLVTPYSASAL